MMATQPDKTCRTCSRALWRRNKSGLCAGCQPHDPEAIRKRNEGWRRACIVRPELLKACGERLRAAAKTPEHAERARKMMVEQRLWERGIEALGKAGSPVRIKAGKRLTASRLQHIPPEHRDEYRRLVNIKRLSAAEATRVITEQHEHELERLRRRILPLGETRPGAAVVPLPLPDDILAAAAQLFCIEASDLTAQSRAVDLIKARCVVVKVLREEGQRYSSIGRLLHRDHTSVIHLFRTFDERAAADPYLLQAVDRLVEARA